MKVTDLLVFFSFTITALANGLSLRDGHSGLALTKRQANQCQTQCASLEQALSCSTSACVCPILNATGASAIATCATCLETIQEFAMYASFLPLLGKVCSGCANPCSSLLTQIIVQAPACVGSPLSCACSIFNTVSSAAISSCTSCIQSFDPVDASGVLAFENQCGVSLPSNSTVSNTTSTAPTSPTTSQAAGGSTVTGVTSSTASAGSPASASVTLLSHSGSTKFTVTFSFMEVFCMVMISQVLAGIFVAA